MNAATTTLGNGPSLSAIVFFALFVLLALGITLWAARRTRSTEEFYAAGRRVTAAQNGFALVGDFHSAAGFLGIAGYIVFFGADGLALTLIAIVAFPLMSLLIAEPLRNLGKYTFTDVLQHRTGSTALRLVSMACGLAIIMMYLILQMVGAGSLLKLLFGWQYEASVIAMGGIILVYVLLGGMLAATWMQIVKTVLMIGIAFVLMGLALAQFDGNPIAMLRAAVDLRGPGILGPGRIMSNPLEAISVVMGAFGAASLPHVLMRFYTVPDVRVARRSLVYAGIIINILQICTVILGFAAMVLVGADAIRAADPGGNMALPLLAEKLGGTIFLGLFCAVAFATMLGVLAGLIVAGSAAISHDFWLGAIRGGQASRQEQLLVARIATGVLCVVAVGLGILFKGQNIGWLVGLATGVAASAIFPALVLAIYWPRLTAEGAMSGMIVGLVSNATLIYLSPLVQVEMLHHAEAVIELRNPAVITMPLAFLTACIVSLATYAPAVGNRWTEVQRRMVLGPADG